MSEREKTKTMANPVSGDDKAKALEAARLQIEKQFGSGSLMKLGDHSISAGIEVVSSGSILLDEALGIGGYPRGRIIEIYGLESSGKTTLALHAVAEAQRLGGTAAFVDAEHALDPVYAKNLGVKTEELWISQPDSGEQALEITESLVRSGAVDVIVVDSVAALTPQAEIEGDMGDAQMGLQARLMSQAMRKLTAIIGKSRTILIFINQIRMKIGMMFGNPETTTGGNALKFYASIRLEVRKVETIEAGKDTDAIGNRVKVKVVKNKMAPPFRKVELEIIFGKGVSAIGSLLDAAVKHEIIDKKGAWYSYGEEKVGQGRENAREYLEKNPDFAKDIESQLRKIMFPGRVFPEPVKAAATEKTEKPAETEPAAQAPVEAADTTEKPAEAELVAQAAGEKAVETPELDPTVQTAELVTESEASYDAAPAPKPAAPPPPHRGPGRPPANSRPAVPPPPAAEAPRGPGRPRKVQPSVDEGLF